MTRRRSQGKVVPQHQANEGVHGAAANRQAIPLQQFYTNIEHSGNTSGARIPLALKELEWALQKGDKPVLCSVGAGIIAAGMAVEW